MKWWKPQAHPARPGPVRWSCCGLMAVTDVGPAPSVAIGTEVLSQVSAEQAERWADILTTSSAWTPVSQKTRLCKPLLTEITAWAPIIVAGMVIAMQDPGEPAKKGTEGASPPAEEARAALRPSPPPAASDSVPQGPPR
jgi:hypothetical protein